MQSKESWQIDHLLKNIKIFAGLTSKILIQHIYGEVKLEIGCSEPSIILPTCYLKIFFFSTILSNDNLGRTIMRRLPKLLRIHPFHPPPSPRKKGANIRKLLATHLINAELISDDITE